MSSRLNHPARRAAEAIVRRLHDAGHIAYFAGGCVRDELLGLTPSDYDVATDAVPDRVMELFPRSGEVGKSFGVVLVRVGREVVEVATFRSDGTYSDKRRPDSVRFSSPQEDAQRRDYTVNALFLDPLQISTANPGGQIIDFVGGLQDLSKRILRAVGIPDQRLDEDHLRALRGVRLAAKLGFELDPPTAQAIRRHASALSGVSRERIGEEVCRMIEHPTRAQAAESLAALDLEQPVFMLNSATPPHRLGPRKAERLRRLPATCDYAVGLATWAIDLGLVNETRTRTELVNRWRKSLCLSNEVRANLEHLLAGLLALETEWAGMRIASRKRAAGSAWFHGAVQILETCDQLAANTIRTDEAALAATASGIAPEPILTGDHLVAAGWKPGPGFKKVLDGVYDAQLEEKVRNLDEAMELARKLGV